MVTPRVVCTRTCACETTTGDSRGQKAQGRLNARSVTETPRRVRGRAGRRRRAVRKTTRWPGGAVRRHAATVRKRHARPSPVRIARAGDKTAPFAGRMQPNVAECCRLQQDFVVCSRTQQEFVENTNHRHPNLWETGREKFAWRAGHGRAGLKNGLSGVGVFCVWVVGVFDGRRW